jgi:hypothetical protein
MTYDSVRGRVVLFGGINTIGTPLDDVWEWDGMSWIRRFTQPDPTFFESPVGRWQAGFVYDRSRNVYVLHGGRHFVTTRQPEGDTWELNGAGQWALKATAPASQADPKHDLVFDTGMAYDEFGRTLLATVNNMRATIWEWNGTAWKNLAALPLGGNTLAYDAGLKRTLLVGGGSNVWSFPHGETREWHYFDQSCNEIP